MLSQFSLYFKHMAFCRYPRYPWMYDTFGRIPGLKKLFTPYNYTENLYRFSTPLLVIAGGQDKLAPKTDMQYVKEHVGSTDVIYLEFSKDAGYHNDYRPTQILIWDAMYGRRSIRRSMNGCKYTVKNDNID